MAASDPSKSRRAIQIAILGAGMSGICMGIRLKRAGFERFTIFEKAGQIGGTWRDNTYPGLACDVPSHLYSFSFEPKADWSRVYASGWEIQQYFEHCVHKYGLEPHLRLGHEIVEARFDDGLWHLRAARGERFRAHVVITAVGALHHPSYPEIPGLDAFRGTQFHSARWNHDHDLGGRKVAVIGSAASAAQIVPAIAAQTARLHVFQRTANWIRPRLDHAYAARRQQRYARFPILEKLHRWSIYWQMEAYFPVFRRPGYANRQARKVCLAHLHRQIADPAMRRALTPDYLPGCKRILVSDDFYPALRRDNVELVTAPIARVTADAIVTGDGRERAIDTLIFATGFHATKPLAGMSVTGRDRQSLATAWRDGIEAHRTVAVAGFPNFFMLLGPNSGLGHNSIIFMTEAQVGYVIECLEAITRWGIESIEPKRAASDRYNDALQRDMQRTIWKSGCRSWYQDERGKVVALWPRSSLRYWFDMRRVNFREYHLQAAHRRSSA